MGHHHRVPLPRGLRRPRGDAGLPHRGSALLRGGHPLPGARRGNLRGVPDPLHHGPPHPRVLPQRASPAAVVSRAVAGAPHGDQPGDSRRARPGAGRLGLDREPLGQGAPDRGPLLRHRARHHQLRAPVVVPGAGPGRQGLQAVLHQLHHRPHGPGQVQRLVHGTRLSGEGVQGHAREQPLRQPHPLRQRRHRDHPRLVRSAPRAFTPTSSTRKRKEWEK